MKTRFSVLVVLLAILLGGLAALYGPQGKVIAEDKSAGKAPTGGSPVLGLGATSPIGS